MTEARTIIEQSSAGVMTSLATIFLQDAISTMMPWLFTMLAVIVCDLAFGVRKSMKLGIHISPSRALRATMSKMVTYVAWVMAVAMIDCAAGHTLEVTKWACLLVCLIEGMSIVGNMLKPYGYDFSVKGSVVFFLSLVFRQDKEKLEDLIKDEHLDVITARERKKWGDVKKKVTVASPGPSEGGGNKQTEDGGL